MASSNREIHGPRVKVIKPRPCSSIPVPQLVARFTSPTRWGGTRYMPQIWADWYSRVRMNWDSSGLIVIGCHVMPP